MSLRLGRYDSTSNSADIHSYDVLTGAPSGFTRHYLSMEDNWNGPFTQYSYSRDRIPVITAHAWTSTRQPIPWADIAAGNYDSLILAHASDLKALPGRNVPAYIVFHHEPENEEDGKVSGDITGTCGTRADFIAAAERFRSVIRQALSTTDAMFGITLMAGTYRSGRYTTWAPPTFQFYGLDGYSHGSTKETFSYIATPAHDAAVTDSRKLFIEELGCEEIAGTTFKPDFFADMRSISKTWPELLGIEYSNVKAKGDYRVDTTPESLGAWKTLATDPYFTGAWT